jgi:hypothetical protein
MLLGIERFLSQIDSSSTADLRLVSKSPSAIVTTTEEKQFQNEVHAVERGVG